MSRQDDQASELQLQMARLRSDLAIRSEQLTRQTRLRMSWRYQVARHPVASAAAAMALGFWLAPSRKRKDVSRVSESLDELQPQKSASRDARPNEEPHPQGSSIAGTIIRSVASAAGTVLLRQVATALFQGASDSFVAKSSPSNAESGPLVQIHGDRDD